MKKKALAVLIMGMAVVLTACGNNDSSSSEAKFNKQDVTFAQDMIPHHRQAVEMAKLADTRASSPQVKDIAAEIQGAQDPEIMKMTGWLKDWDKPVPDNEMSGMDHGSGDNGAMTGMMSDADMKSLDSSSGTAFDTMFLTMMIKHHEGAVAMADDEVADGSNSEAIALAKTIIGGQTDEIARMKDLLKQ
ncbi:MAG: DUF305 domain-containing protein [Kineosporiaceae bacterium]|nr:DUF305 domain-containing protein [Aeromicrobium sp.]